jgi:NAD(P)-dependent dehydrogenase (short-subunit alcohol dehydrogenase family)
MSPDPLGVLVTGAAGCVGRAVVGALADVGMRIHAVDLPGSELRELAATYLDRGHEIVWTTGDLTKPGAADAVVAAAEEALGGLDAVVHTVGVAGRGAIDVIDDAAWRRVLEVNLSTSFFVCRAAVPVLRRRGRGAIVVLASSAALREWPGSVAYAASKAGVVGLTRTLAAELATEEIRVWSLCPTAIDTRMVSNALDATGDPVAAREAYVAAQPMGRLIRPEEVAAQVVHLLTARPPYTPDPLVV